MGHIRQRLIAFDLDGTLIDSSADLATAANRLVLELGGTPLAPAAIVAMVGEGAATLVARVLDAAGLPRQPQALTRFLALYDDCLLDTTRPYDGVVEAVVYAAGLGTVSLLTNKPQAATERILEGLGLRGFFRDVIAGDTPHGRKPDPQGLRVLMDRAGARPGDSVLVGDSAIDHATARAGGARACMAAYGFGYATFPRERLDGTEWVADTPAGLRLAFEAFAQEA